MKTGTETGSASGELSAIAQEWWDFGLDESPAWCTALGLERGADRLDERGPRARERRARAISGFLRRLADVPTASLSEEERITRAILVRAASEDRRRCSTGRGSGTSTS